MGLICVCARLLWPTPHPMGIFLAELQRLHREHVRQSIMHFDELTDHVDCRDLNVAGPLRLAGASCTLIDFDRELTFRICHLCQTLQTSFRDAAESWQRSHPYSR